MAVIGVRIHGNISDQNKAWTGLFDLSDGRIKDIARIACMRATSIFQ